MEQQGNQFIQCNIKSCKHCSDGVCVLQSIQVSPCSSMSTGLPEDETMCYSYERKE